MNDVAEDDRAEIATAADRSGSLPLRSWRFPLATWASVWALLVVTQFVGRSTNDQSTQFVWSRFFDGWNAFDGPEYLSIAARGYTYRQLVWFPVYPHLIRVVALVLHNRLLAGVLISTIAGAIAACLAWTWLGHRCPNPRAHRAAFLGILLYPYGWYLYGVVYSDALFLALVLGAFVLIDRDRLLAAGLVGAVATATRPTGIAIILALFVAGLVRRQVIEPGAGPTWAIDLELPLRFRRERWRPRDLAPLLSAVGLLAYMTYLWVDWGSPVRYITVQELYHDADWRTLMKMEYFAQWSGPFDGRYLASATAQAVLVVLALLCTTAVGRRYGWGAGVLTGSIAVIPALTVGVFIGSGRYLMAAFPFAAFVGEWVGRRPPLVRGLAVAIAVGVLMVMSFGYSRGWYLS
ncbi:MAG: hypothetical protein ACOYOP_08805 [Microthrixaceae bacterium]